MPVNDVLEVRYVSTAGLQVSLNVRHYVITSVGAPEPTHQDIADRLGVVMATQYKTQLSSSATFRGIGVRRLLPPPRTAETVDGTTSGPGTRGADLLPKQIAAVISLRTAEATRRGRGRMYIPFPSETDNTSAGLPVAAYGTDLVNLAALQNDLITVTAGGGTLVMTPVIFRRSDGTTRVITQVNARSIWGTQRRRGDFGRTNEPPF